MTNCSAAQARASRDNGAKSQGPVSEAGKLVAAGNSRKHGLCAKEFVLETAEEQQRFDGLLAELVFTHQARNPLEVDACHHLAVAMWRRRVCDNLERELLLAIRDGRACAVAGGDGLPGLNAINRYRARINRDLKDARAEIAELKALRVKAFEAEMRKAGELASLRQRGELEKELGAEGFKAFRASVTNEPEPAQADVAQTNPSPPPAPESSGPNRTNRRRLEKLARKQNSRKK